MKLLHTPLAIGIEHTLIASGALVGIYFASVAYLNSNDRRFDRAGSTWLDSQAELRPVTLDCNLPVGWRAAWVGRTLWLTCYNSDGTVADSLGFGSLNSLYDWIETHPDFCDVNVATQYVDVADTDL